jgi:hypothetical protein
MLMMDEIMMAACWLYLPHDLEAQAARNYFLGVNERHDKLT